MSTGTILIQGGIVVTQDADLGTIPAGDVLIEDGYITDVRTSIDPPMGALVIDARDDLVLPGLIDGHRHLGFGLRGTSGDWSFHDFLREWKLSTVGRLTPEDVHAFTLANAMDALNAGVTSVVDHSNYLSSPEHARAALLAVRESGIRAVWCFGLADPVPDARPLEVREALGAELWDEEFGGRDDPEALVRMGIATEEPETVGMATLGREIGFARSLGVPVITAHLNCKPDRGTGRWPGQVAALAAADELGRDLLLSHMNMTSDDEWAMVRSQGVNVCATPESEMKSGMGRTCLLAEPTGVRPALGIDLVGFPSGDLFAAMRIGLATERLFRNSVDGNAVSTEAALGWATTNGAHAIGQGSRLGSISPGKLADVIVIRTRDIGFAGFDAGRPVSVVVGQASASSVGEVIVAGAIVKTAGRLVGDVKTAVEHASASASRLYRVRPGRGAPHDDATASLAGYYRT